MLGRCYRCFCVILMPYVRVADLVAYISRQSSHTHNQRQQLRRFAKRICELLQDLEENTHIHAHTLAQADRHQCDLGGVCLRANCRTSPPPPLLSYDSIKIWVTLPTRITLLTAATALTSLPTSLVFLLPLMLLHRLLWESLVHHAPRKETAT